MVDFEKGSANSDLIFLDGRLAGFHVESKQIPDNWFKGPNSTELYRSRGREFLEGFLSGDADSAFARMDRKLQKKLPLKELKSKLAETTTKVGKLKSVDYQSESLNADGSQTLSVLYRLRGEQGESPAKLTFEFVGLRGFLIDCDLATSAK
jgi:hypothetical protein